MTSIIQIDHLYYRPESKNQNQQDVLQDINLSIDAGSFVAIVGNNGSGKTTLMKQISGLLFPTQGRVLVNGLDTRQPDNRKPLRSLVGMVFQNPADQIVASTVEEDIAFGLENLNLPTKLIQQRVSEQLSRADLTDESQRPPHLLSGGQTQRLALAGVLARQPKLILFDEPTTMLDPLSRKNFLNQLMHLRYEGFTIIYVTHHMEEVVDADTVVILDAGRIYDIGPPDKVFDNHNKLYEIGLKIPESFEIDQRLRQLGLIKNTGTLSLSALIASLPSYQRIISNKGFDEGLNENNFFDPFIQFNDVHYTYFKDSPFSHLALQGINLSIENSSITMLAGSNGSGKSTLLQHINGILRPDSGDIQVGELRVSDYHTKLQRIIKDVGLVFQNPEDQFFELFVGDEIAFGPKQFNLPNVRTRVRSAMEQVGLDFQLFKDRKIETLSGGEKRKVAIASTLALDQNTLLFDEPTAGMDSSARDALLELFCRLQSVGKTILIASHRINELLPLLDQLVIMESGQISYSIPRTGIVKNQNVIADAGLELPISMQISQALIAKGWPINNNAMFSTERLLAAIQGLIL